jgi:hypothetical protein
MTVVHTHVYKFNEGAHNEIFVPLMGYRYVKFGNHCICIKFKLIFLTKLHLSVL